MVKVAGFSFIFLIIAVGVIGLISPEIQEVNIDFQNYYGEAGAYDPFADPEIQDLLSLSIFADVDTVTVSHAATKHADDTDIYQKCMQDGNTIMGFIDPTNNHCVEVMETSVEEGGHSVKQWLVRVVKQVEGRWCEITAFSDEWEAVNEVEDYLIRQGYMYMWP